MMTPKVSFADGAIVHEIDHHDTFSPEEIESSWFTTKEYRCIRQRDAAIVNSIVRNTVQEDDDVCIRGLEGRTPVAAESKRTNFIDVTYNVLDEQQRQSVLGISEPKKIASLHRKCTKSCVKAAKEQGRRDWQSIKESEIEATEDEDKEVPHVNLPGHVALLDEFGTIPKKKQGSKNRIQRFLGLASNQRGSNRHLPPIADQTIEYSSQRRGQL